MLEAMIRVLAPHYCIGCDAQDRLLCEACQVAALRPVPSRCYRCKRLTSDHAVCVSCRHQGPLKHVWIATEYTAVARELVHRMKYERARAGVVPIAEVLAATLPLLDATIVPIPTASRRVRQRGYDQSRLIARRTARLRRVPYQELLVRTSQARQVGAERSVRLEQASRFFAAKPVRAFPERIVLIDDVITTGATVQAAARCLRRAGVRHISALVFAQKQ